MNIRDLFPDVDLTKGFSAFAECLKETDGKIISAMIAELSNSTGGNLFVGVDDFGKVNGLSVDEIIHSKSLLVSFNQTLLSAPAALRFAVKNVDSMSESCVLYVSVQPSVSKIHPIFHASKPVDYAGEDFNDFAPSSFEAFASVAPEFDSSLYCTYLALCQRHRSDFNLPDANELHQAGLIDDHGNATPEFSLWSDSPSCACPKISAFLYRGVEKSELVLDSFESSSSLSKTLISLIAFIERNTRKGKAVDSNGIKIDRESYPGMSFVRAFAAGLSHLDYSSSPGEIAISLFANRLEFECFGPLLDSSCLDVTKNRLMHACLSVMGVSKDFDTCFQDIFASYSGLPKSFEPHVVCGKNSFTIILFDTLYEPTVFQQRILDNELSPEQEKALELLSSGPKTTLELMFKSPYRSRAAFGKFVINPLIQGGKIARIGKINSPKAKLIRLK